VNLLWKVTSLVVLWWWKIYYNLKIILEALSNKYKHQTLWYSKMKILKNQWNWYKYRSFQSLGSMRRLILKSNLQNSLKKSFNHWSTISKGREEIITSIYQQVKILKSLLRVLSTNYNYRLVLKERNKCMSLA
jgi:hypothetical protein